MSKCALKYMTSVVLIVSLELVLSQGYSMFSCVCLFTYFPQEMYLFSKVKCSILNYNVYSNETVLSHKLLKNIDNQ